MENGNKVSSSNILLLFIIPLLVLFLFIIYEQSTSLQNTAQELIYTTEKIQSTTKDSLRLSSKALNELALADDRLIDMRNFSELNEHVQTLSAPEKKQLIHVINTRVKYLYRISKNWDSATSILLSITCVFTAFFFISKIRTLKIEISQLQSELNDLQSRLSKASSVTQMLNKKWRATRSELALAIKSQDKLKEEIRKSDSEYEELTSSLNEQIQTNEQLFSAESLLTDLLEKEQESKAILKQTLEHLKETQTQLVYREKMASLGQLTAAISHEINNPVNFVYNGVENLRRTLAELEQVVDKYSQLDSLLKDHEIIQQVLDLKDEIEYEEIREDLDNLMLGIREGAIRTIEIVKGLRIYAKPAAEEMQEANVNECLDATLALLKYQTKNKIKVSRNYDESLEDISCFPSELNQVFMNIVTNAIQAIPAEQGDGEIIVSTFRTEDGICIKIRDNGVGISSEVKDRIFEPFFTTKTAGSGAGLGMSISYGIIEKHQGRLSLESTEGEGTEFTIELANAVQQTLNEAS